MELTFNNNDSVYVSEFKVDSDFNLHVERDELGKFIIWVKTTPVGNYAKVNHEENLDDLYVIDYNFTGTVYPKYIKIVSKVEPTYAAITTDGEVTEIKTQSKEIEITSNGITNITPDSGFAYLDRVSVKTNVAQSGEGGGSTGGGNTYEYIDVRRPSGYQGDDFMGEVFTPLVYMCALMVKANVESMQIVGTSGSLVLMGDSAFQNVTAIAVDTNMEVFSGTGHGKVGDLMKEIGADSLPRLTKEEFYNLNA